MIYRSDVDGLCIVITAVGLGDPLDLNLISFSLSNVVNLTSFPSLIVPFALSYLLHLAYMSAIRYWILIIPLHISTLFLSKYSSL